MIRNMKKILGNLVTRGNSEDGTVSWAQSCLEELDRAKAYQQLRDNEAFKDLAQIFHNRFSQRLQELVESDQELTMIQDYYRQLYKDDEVEMMIRNAISERLSPKLVENLESDNS